MTTEVRHYTGNLPSERFAVGDRLGNARHPSDVRVVTRVDGEYVFTRNEYSGAEGVMLRDFYARNFRRLLP